MLRHIFKKTIYELAWYIAVITNALESDTKELNHKCVKVQSHF